MEDLGVTNDRNFIIFFIKKGKLKKQRNQIRKRWIKTSYGLTMNFRSKFGAT